MSIIYSWEKHLYYNNGIFQLRLPNEFSIHINYKQSVTHGI